MKKLWVFIGIFALFFLTMSDNAFSKSAENKAACERWCNDNKPRCVRCDSNVFCGGRTHDVIKSFKKGTGNWYACGLSEYGRESRKNKDECEDWCGRDERCEYCRDYVGCGSGYSSIKMFGGRGENWYACKYNYSTTEGSEGEGDSCSAGNKCTAHPSRCMSRRDFKVDGKTVCNGGVERCEVSEEDYCFMPGGRCGRGEGRECDPGHPCAPGMVCAGAGEFSGALRCAVGHCEIPTGFCWTHDEVGDANLVCRYAR